MIKRTKTNQIIAAIVTGQALDPLELGDGEAWFERRLYPGRVPGYTLAVDAKTDSEGKLTFQAELVRPDGTASFAVREQVASSAEFSERAEAVAREVARLGLVDARQFDLAGRAAGFRGAGDP